VTSMACSLLGSSWIGQAVLMLLKNNDFTESTTTGFHEILHWRLL